MFDPALLMRLSDGELDALAARLAEFGPALAAARWGELALSEMWDQLLAEHDHRWRCAAAERGGALVKGDQRG